ncbi:MAG: hypothetical protein CMM50_12185 [Rhodospirillaceae bacterium]|nr:hypothetical protein [Rhodospirillaceae bacterium]
MRIRHLFIGVGLAAFTIAVILLGRNLRQYSVADIAQSVAAIPAETLLLGVGLTVASYTVLAGFDLLAVRYAGARLPWRAVALASFVSMSIGHNIGLAGFGSGALRYRFYAGWGIRPGDVIKIILFCGLTVALGLVALAGLVSLLQPSLAARFTGASRTMTTLAGAACLAVPLLYLAIAGFRRRPVRVGRIYAAVPSLPLALAQLAVATANYALVAGLLYVLLAPETGASYAAVVSVYVLATVAAIASQVPGGLGVLEAVVIALVPDANVVAALIVFRALYFLVPLTIGGGIFLVRELSPGRPGTALWAARRWQRERRSRA